ncbi:unnamed protein product [Prorocentrum cordatum]|uniref:40S ribosomal protein S7 n=1 Tax=Prorocentrum cordatum TaxID=2364126 RepID=A0ABN9QYR8_9DINO|nr:unnamed protein product [Polarella glacialis]
MINARKKIVKDKGAAPTELEEEVAKALLDIEVSPSSDIKADLRDIYISGAKEVDAKMRKAVVVHFPFRVWGAVKKIQGRLIRELEKKFQKKHVVFVAHNRGPGAPSWTRISGAGGSRCAHAAGRSRPCTTQSWRTSSDRPRLWAGARASAWMARS